MTIIVFLLDTSASMNQRVFLGGRPTLLDVAKSAVETFVKVRQRSIDSRGDRYMLLTFEEPPANIKAGWKENLATFMSELKNLQANGLTTLGNALRHTFDVLNVNRMQHGIDTYGQGKCPFYLEPSIIVCITDGGQLSSNSGVQDELKMHGSSPGFELTREPFRWDQRLFSLVLRMTGQPSGERETGLVPSDHSPIDVMCEVTGGRSYAITTHRMLHQCIDSLVQKVQAGVVIHFEKCGPDPPTIDGLKTEDDVELMDEKNGNKIAWHGSRRMIYVPRSTQKGFAGGFWPIPESFWPDPTLPTLPSRTAHPNIKFMCQPAEPMVVENFPFDKYELEPSPLTQYMLARKQPTICWQVYMPSSSRNNAIGFPFGYIKSSTNLTCVNLFVMPYNYPILLPLVDELFRIHRLKPTSEWRAQFAMYLSAMPPYYAGPLKRALVRMGAGNIAQSIPEENYLSYSVLSYLKKLKAQAKSDYDRTCNEVALKVKASEPKRVVTSFKNPFDVPRHQLLDHLARLRTHFLRPSQTTAMQHESLHNMPVGQMGNYQEYLKRMPTPLRELESAPVRQHMFGNPFKIDKRMIIDEAVDIDLLGGGQSQAGGGAKVSKREAANAAQQQAALLLQQQQMQAAMSQQSSGTLAGIMSRGPKRKAGPLPKDFRFTPYKNRRTHRGMDEDSDTESFVSSAPSSPAALMSPISSHEYPELLDLIVNDKENSGSSVDSSFNKLYMDNNLVIDESPPDEPMPFGAVGGMFNHDDVMNSHLVINEQVDDPSGDEPFPYEMNGRSNNNDSEEKSDCKIVNEIAITQPPPENGIHTPPTTIITPPPPPVIANHVAPATNNHLPRLNHIGSSNKTNNKKQPVSNNKTSPDPSRFSSPRSLSPAPPPEVDDDTTWKKNLQLRIELHKEIRRPVLRLDYILSQLSSVTGSYKTKQQFVKSLAKEALRFKRQRLAKALNEQAEVLAPFCRPSPS